MARRYRGHLTVDVSIEDLIEELSDDDVRTEYRDRFGDSAVAAPAFDLIEEVYADLIGGRIQSALALIESHRVQAQIKDAKRQAQYQAAGRATGASAPHSRTSVEVAS